MCKYYKFKLQTIIKSVSNLTLKLMSLSSRDSTTKIKQVRTTNSGPCHAHRHDPKHDNTSRGATPHGHTYSTSKTQCTIDSHLQ